ncbi:sensor histidine kinase [Azospirillum picis]|uniref:histidine kinase n=1 Tax=Azospirillum picis TaxID=488438 RepID=A0ABU0MMT5_9PROT|nr:PhnD/SsuA/transferrin family substrate-binding protein [Azospirillum picis]MBP2300512.1 two-component system sensor histidine kinase TtrS [Azospirillum picis]MDQ0534481.1 two-component system sensor histidine kinase TtrS [Azospirillum picis]
MVPRSALRVLIAAVVLTVCHPVGATSASMSPPLPPIRVAVLAYRGGDHANAVWEPTIRYLAGRFPDRGAEMVPLDLPGMEEAVQGRTVDFVLTNTGNYVELEARHGIARIATLQSSRTGTSGASVGSALIVRADRADIRDLADLKGRTVLASDPDAFGGFQVAWGEMVKAGIDPYRDLKELRFSGFPLDRIAFAVRDGDSDVGVLRACLLEELAAEGRIDPGRFRVLAPKAPPGFGCSVSTDLYPDWPLARLASTPETLAKAVAVALFQMPANDPAAAAGGYAGWTVPLDYQPVHALFRSLRIGPYRYLRELSLVDIAREHWQWLAVAALALLWWAIHSLRVEHLIKVRTAELHAANRGLRHEMAERRRAEEVARERQKDMDHIARLSILGEMASNLAHELNQPLGAISNYARGCTRRLEAGTGDPAQLAGATRAIAEQAERAGQIIARIRNFVRKRAPQPEPMDVNDGVHAAVALCEGQARTDSAAITLSLAGDLPPVLADRVQIEQVILNLVKNALDAMADTKPGGAGDAVRVVSIRTGRDREGRVEVAVADRGHGLAADAKARLFEPFFTTKPGGMGLGLSICRTIVEAHGGHLWASDNPGGGTVMRFVLPATTEEHRDDR